LKAVILPVFAKQIAQETNRYLPLNGHPYYLNFHVISLSNPYQSGGSSSVQLMVAFTDWYLRALPAVPYRLGEVLNTWCSGMPLRP
jgi:hypothetical protein